METDQFNQSEIERLARATLRLRPLDLGQEGIEKVRRVWETCVRTTYWPKGDYPYGEHDFGKFEVEGDNFVLKTYRYFKIDYYSLDEMHGSEHPDSPLNVTIRVLALMYVEGY